LFIDDTEYSFLVYKSYKLKWFWAWADFFFFLSHRT
jgi:hypothetical protein